MCIVIGENTIGLISRPSYFLHRILVEYALKEKEQLHLAPLSLIIVRPKGRPKWGAMAALQKTVIKERIQVPSPRRDLTHYPIKLMIDLAKYTGFAISLYLIC